MGTCVTMLMDGLHNAAEMRKLLSEKEVVAACIQALETEHAGRIQATAARQAGTMGLGAGLLAFIAGILAYIAATLQLRFEQLGHVSRQVAYNQQMEAILTRTVSELEAVLSTIEGGSDDVSRPGLSAATVTSLDLCRNKLLPTQWAEHALLGTAALRQTVVCYEAVQRSIEVIERLVRSPFGQRLADARDTIRLSIRETSNLVELVSKRLNELSTKEWRLEHPWLSRWKLAADFIRSKRQAGNGHVETV